MTLNITVRQPHTCARGGQKFLIAFLTHNLLPLTRVRRRIFPKISEIIAFLTKNFSPPYEGLFFIAFLTHNFLGRTNEGRGGVDPPLAHVCLFTDKTVLGLFITHVFYNTCLMCTVCLCANKFVVNFILVIYT